jgi:hypothetical protein
MKQTKKCKICSKAIRDKSNKSGYCSLCYRYSPQQQDYRKEIEKKRKK